MVRDRTVPLVHILLADDEEVYEGQVLVNGDGGDYGLGNGDGYGDGIYDSRGYGEYLLHHYELNYGRGIKR